MARPVLFVLAGVNGAGKSSIGGHLLQRAGLTWFNPDTFARELVAATGCGQEAANGLAWSERVRRLDAAVGGKRTYAFETTLGGHTIAAKIREAARTHDVIVWFCGLTSPEQHIARVRALVTQGGHDIPEAKIRARFPRAHANLIGLLTHCAHVRVYDNSVDVAVGEAVPDPSLVLEVIRGRVAWPRVDDRATLARTPDWAKPLVEAALTES
ncbi:MAG: hypothetical protein EXQ49_10660 [Acidobacteria bacterium]|nr:hypothetical protein [Acidobacteriota bacterium]